MSDERERALRTALERVAHEAHTRGRIYSEGGEKANPGDEYTALLEWIYRQPEVVAALREREEPTGLYGVRPGGSGWMVVSNGVDIGPYDTEAEAWVRLLEMNDDLHDLLAALQQQEREPHTLKFGTGDICVTPAARSGVAVVLLDPGYGPHEIDSRMDANEVEKRGYAPGNPSEDAKTNPGAVRLEFTDQESVRVLIEVLSEAVVDAFCSPPPQEDET